MFIYARNEMNAWKIVAAALIFFSSLFWAIVSDVPVIQLNTAAFGYVCNQKSRLKGSFVSFCLKAFMSLIAPPPALHVGTQK